MQILNRCESLARRGRASGQSGGLVVAAAAGVAAAVFAVFTVALVLLPSALVLPVTALGLMLAAAALAIIAWATPGDVGSARLVYWDIAGALTVIGVCAALFGETGEAVALLERERS